MDSRIGMWRQKIKQHPFITVGVVIALLAIIAFMFAVHMFGWDWTGFTGGESKITITTTSKGITTAKELQPGKALWDWLGLLAALAIPVVVGIGAAWFTAQQAKVSDKENKDNQLEAALQAYIDKISELLLKEHLGERTADGKLKQEYEQVRKIARLRTITAMTQLDSRRISYVFAFLREAGLISNKSESIISLSGANLSKANLSGANLSEVNLSEANLSEVNLSKADLSKANLSGRSVRGGIIFIDISGANLSGAILWDANLSYANLTSADLSKADLGKADLTRASFGVANLSGAFLGRANLHKAFLSGANLSKANLSKANLSEASLSGRITFGGFLRETHLTNLSDANLTSANFSKANLSEASLERANLSGANLSEAFLASANLTRANLTRANLSDADLTRANLSKAKITEEQLKTVKSLEGATMPDGSKHP